MSAPNPDDEDHVSSGQTDEQRSSQESVETNGNGSGEFNTQTEANDSVDESWNTASQNGRSEEGNIELSALQSENTTLSADYARARKASHRKTAVALVAIGVIAGVTGVAFPDVRAIMFVTGSIGLFGGVLTWYFTPERVVPVAVSESIYDATASTLTGMRDELGLQPLIVYVPIDDRVRAFIPQFRPFELPDNRMPIFVADNGVSRGISFRPTGQHLMSELCRIRTTPMPDNAITTAEQAGDVLVEHFEIVDRVSVEDEAEQSTISISVRNAAFGPLTRIDHPVISTVACSVVQAVDEPVVVEPIDDTTVEFSMNTGTNESL